ncbi:TonB-dependent receptor [Selenomonas sp. F0473]|uniref:TonB-dependent receptor n=1 Tax=Selenomonas sp. F0473 TaxID=999423 RepID=UPI0025E909DD|nr:TonB-dependent siderophore receptor [Selenomonas sp. F0473]
METMKKKRLSAAILAALLSMSVSAHASEKSAGGGTNTVDTYELDPVDVEGRSTDDTMPGGNVARTASLGALGEDAAVMETPVNVTSYTDAVLKKNFVPTRAFLNAATNNPSVQVGGASTDNNVELQIRGVEFNTHDILLDGVPGMIMMQNQPTNYIGRMEIITGPNAVVSGTGTMQSAAGFVNFVPKKAGPRPVFDITQSYASSRYLTTGIDWGRRFGKNQQFGIRINTEAYTGRTTSPGEELRGRDLYINIDRDTARSKSSLLYGYDTSTHHGMPEVLRIKDANWGTNVTHLPSASAVVKNFMPSWALVKHTHRVYLFQHEQKFNEHITGYVKAGLMHRDWPGYLTSKPWLQNDAGDYTLSIDGSSTMGKTNRRVFMTGVKLNFDTGAVNHAMTIGYDYLSQHGWSNEATGTTSNMTGNIYRGLITDPGAPHAPEGQWYVGSKLNNRSVVFADAITALDGRLKLIAGLRRQTIYTRNFSKTGALTKSYEKSATTPTFAALYKLSPRTALYVNYAESLTSGATTPNTVVNKNEVMPPTKTKQYEFGAKWDMGDWGTTLSLFRIKQPTGLVNAANYYVMDGETRSQGVEWNIFGKVAPRLSLTGGMMLLDAKYEKTDGGVNDGNRVFGTPRFNATMALDWETPVRGLNVYGRLLHMGSTYADSKNRIEVPSWTRFDLGAQYETKIDGYPTTFNLMIYNVLNKMYWSSTTVKWSDGGLMLNPGRTFMLSAAVSL